MTMPVSHVTVRVPLTVRRRPGRKTLVWLRFGVEGGSIATKADPALLEGGRRRGHISANTSCPARRHNPPNGGSGSRRDVQSYRLRSHRLAMRQATVKAGLKTLPTS